MKYKTRINRISSVVMVIALLVVLTNCGGDDVTPIPVDDTNTIKEQQAEVSTKLSSATWQTSSVTRDNSDASAEFADLRLSFGNQTYTSQNGLHVWPASGTWKFVDGKTDQVVRDDGVIIDVSVSDTSLTLSFEFEENVFITGGRVQTVASNLVFVLNK